MAIYVGVSNFLGETSCLYLHAIRYRSGGTSPPTLNFWPGGSSPPTPTCGHGRVAMVMSLATFYRAWPWPYVGVSFLRGTSCLYLHAMRYRCAGRGPVPPQRYISGLGDQSPHTPTCGHGRAAMAMSLATWYRASPWPWPWPRFTEAQMFILK